MMRQLRLEVGDEVVVRYKKLNKLNYAKFKPESAAFSLIPDPQKW